MSLNSKGVFKLMCYSIAVECPLCNEDFNIKIEPSKKDGIVIFNTSCPHCKENLCKTYYKKV